MAVVYIYFCVLFALTFGEEGTGSFKTSIQKKEAKLIHEIADTISSDVVMTQRLIGRTSRSKMNSQQVIEDIVRDTSRATRLKIEPKIRELSRIASDRDPSDLAESIAMVVNAQTTAKAHERSKNGGVRGRAMGSGLDVFGIMKMFIAKVLLPIMM